MQKNLNGCFLGSSSFKGFTSFYSELYSPRDGDFAYIIKGGAGTGKSTLMKNIRQLLNEKGIESECILCSSDPGSLDALIVPDLKCCITDGTSPHVTEPAYFGVSEEIINLGEYLDRESLLKKRESIISLADKAHLMHKRTQRSLEGAALLHSEIKNIISPCLERDKIKELSFYIEKKEFNTENQSPIKTSTRLLEAMTPEGVYFCRDKALECCDRFYIIEDEYSVFAPELLKLIREFLLSKNISHIISPNIFSKDFEISHILVPELKLGFITKNRLNNIDLNAFKTIKAKNFENSQIKNKRENTLRFILKAYDEFIFDAEKYLKEAKFNHSLLEAQYISSMDFEKSSKLSFTIFNKMLKNI